MPEDFVDEPICVSDSFWFGKLSRNRGEGCLSRFFVENVLSPITEKILEEAFCVSKIFSIEMFYAEEGDITTFCWKLLVSLYLKNFVGESFGESEKHCIEKFYKMGGRREYQDFPSERFCLTVPKNFVEERFSASLISGI